jgi:chaperonin GroES
MKLQPLADRIVAKNVETEAKSASGLLLPESAKEQPQIANVLEVGSDVKEIKVGDRIVYSENYDNRPEKIKVGDDELLILKEETVLAIVKE